MDEFLACIKVDVSLFEASWMYVKICEVNPCPGLRLSIQWLTASISRRKSTTRRGYISIAIIYSFMFLSSLHILYEVTFAKH